jgi:hypothetical protein
MGVSGNWLTRGDVRETSLSAIITRADGTVEDLGTIAYWHRNPIKRWAENLRIALANARRKLRR